MSEQEITMPTGKKSKNDTLLMPAQVDAMVSDVQHTAVSSFPIVCIGASAGGLAAFEAFFSNMPPDAEPGMAFVLVQRLAPDHGSRLGELIQRTTHLKVFEVEDGVTVELNCVYIIHPNRDMKFLNGTLQLLEPAAPHSQRLPIDFLLRSLAQDQRERAIGIVLSGTGSDGTLGVRAIKGEDGMVMVQNPDSCEFDGMPRSALGTGMVDYELPPAEMPARLMAYVTHTFGRPPRRAIATEPLSENALKKIFTLLRSQTGHDFSQYKTSTLYRRIERRMTVQQVDTMGDYVKHLQQTPVGVEALFRDLLIGVTYFFRDPEAFDVLEAQVIPKLFEGKPAGSTIRVWCAACSTGEEAYSIAMLLQERLERLRQTYKVQIFATDLDSRAIATARAGIYPASIAGDISAERLARFFTAEADDSAYRVHKGIRDMLVFSEHDLIRDPPFSKLDMISCRNLLIYMNTDLQKKLIALFHYALMPGGMLFLGTSETVGEFGGLFAMLDRNAKAYQRKEDFQGAKRSALVQPVSPVSHQPPATAKEAALLLPTPTAEKVPAPLMLSLREMTEQALLQQVTPTGALVNGQGDILYLHGRTGMFLEPAPGDAGINNILKMAREGLRGDLTTALHKAASTQERTHALNLRVKTNGHFTLVNLTVCPVAHGPVGTPESPLFLVTLDPVHSPAPPASQLAARAVEPGTDQHNKDANAQIAELNEELQAKEEQLHAANEALATANEDLKSSNEKMQSVNEQLQSTNEELATCKEDLQSINEELATVNTELQTKVVDLSRAKHDMNHLLAGTGMGTIFVDHRLRILHFTPAVTDIISLILSDVGRPIAHVVSNLVGYNCLELDTQTVLKTLIPKEIDVLTTQGKSYTLRILPHRTPDNVIEGAAMTFIDITEIVRTREALGKANELLRLAVVVRDAFDAIIVQDLDGRIIAWNPGAERMYGWTELEALKMNVRDRIPATPNERSLASALLLNQAETLEPYQTQRIAKDGSLKEVSLTSTGLINASGLMYAIATTERAKPIKNVSTRQSPNERTE